MPHIPAFEALHGAILHAGTAAVKPQAQYDGCGCGGEEEEEEDDDDIFAYSPPLVAALHPPPARCTDYQPCTLHPIRAHYQAHALHLAYGLAAVHPPPDIYTSVAPPRCGAAGPTTPRVCVCVCVCRLRRPPAPPPHSTALTLPPPHTPPPPPPPPRPRLPLRVRATVPGAAGRRVRGAVRRASSPRRRGGV